MKTRRAFLCFDDYAGYREYPCQVIKETPKRYRIAVDTPTRLAGRNRTLLPGDTALVPKHAVKFYPKE